MEWAGPEPELQAESAQLTADPFLDGFEKIGQNAWFFAASLPAESAAAMTIPENHPELIVVAAWMYAAPRHIAKYTNYYQLTYPFTSILLLRQDGGDFLWRGVEQQMNNMRPAVALVQRLVDEKIDGNLRLLLHLFSNGGSYNATQLADFYSINTGKTLPISALILDSAPGQSDVDRGSRAISEGLPKSEPLRTVGGAFVRAYVSGYEMLKKTPFVQDVMEVIMGKLNSPKSAFMQDGVKRLYIYSEGDLLVDYKQVERHAEQAAEIIGKHRVQLENFGDSSHVGHVRKDGTKYWRLVEAIWKDSVIALKEMRISQGQ